jgi:transposase
VARDQQPNRFFQWWHRVRDGTLPREQFERRMKQVERRVGRLLREAKACAEKKTAASPAPRLGGSRR